MDLDLSMKIPESNNNITKQKIAAAFPAHLLPDVEIVIDFLFTQNFTVHPTSEYVVILDGKQITIPNRIYSAEPETTTGKDLTEHQKIILNCLYLLHSNGYVRQARLRLLQSRTEYFIVPFVFNLVGEYVSEILYDIDSMIDDNTIPIYRRFIEENPVYFKKTESRVISYWNEYHRKVKMKEYVGYQLIKKLKNQNSTL